MRSEIEELLKQERFEEAMVEIEVEEIYLKEEEEKIIEKLKRKCI